MTDATTTSPICSKTCPAVDFQRGTRSAQYNNFAFQGHISNNKLLIMLDGVRIDHPAGGKLPIAENLGLYMAKQVEVLDGPAAALDGADAAAGVIEHHHRQARQPGRQGRTRHRQLRIARGRFHAGQRPNWPIAFRSALAPTSSAATGLTSATTTPAIPQGQCQYLCRRHGHPGQPARELRRRHQQQQPVHATRPCRPDDGSPQTSWQPDRPREFTGGAYRRRLSNRPSKPGPASTASIFRHRSVGKPSLNYSTYEIDPGSRYVNVFTDFQNHGYDYSHARRRDISKA